MFRSLYADLRFPGFSKKQDLNRLRQQAKSEAAQEQARQSAELQVVTRKSVRASV